MADQVLDEIVDGLRNYGRGYFPEHSELTAVRVVGHTPKPDHCTYEIVMDFADGSERVSAKVYRTAKCGVQAAHDLAKHEFRHLNLVHQLRAHRKLPGVPRPLGDFTGNGAVVSTKINGLPLQSLIMKAALLPDFGNHGLLQRAARQTGEWLYDFHKATSQMPAPLDTKTVFGEFEKLCVQAKREGLPEDFTESILDYARTSLSRVSRPVASSAVLNDFVPLNIMVTGDGVGFCEFAQLSETGTSLNDAAMFLAAVEALEKYPFCDRAMTTLVQDAFLDAYSVCVQELQLLTVLKLKVLLQMFTKGRAVKESAERKRVMWANVMKRFIQQAAERSMAPAA
jgi:hypothetical protein